MDDAGVRDVIFEAGYSIGGRMDLSIKGGAMFETLEGNLEVIPAFSFLYDIIMIKQQKAVPFSLLTGLGIGFASSLHDNKSIFGSQFGFNMLLTHDIHLKKFLIGLNGLFQYDRFMYEIRDPASSTDPTSTLHLHEYFYGFGIDIGYTYFENNMVLLQGFLLWDRSTQISFRLKFVMVVPTWK